MNTKQLELRVANLGRQIKAFKIVDERIVVPQVACSDTGIWDHHV